MKATTLSIKKRKIGILTFHNGINHGGFFQAFFLQSFLVSLGHNVKIINYKNSTHWRNEYKSFLITKSPVQLLKNIIKILNFRKNQGNLNLYPKKLTTNRNTLVNISSQFDIIVVGSDVIWDFEFSFTGQDSVYFGDGLQPKLKLISYAASMGRSKSPLPAILSKNLKYFSNVSVRDENTKNYITPLIRTEVTKVLDPTLLMPVSQLTLMSDRLPTEKRKGKNYVLVYAFMLPKSWRHAVESFAASKGLQILVVGYPQKISGRNLTHIGPYNWLKCFKQADYVITSTFHGTIFSIINEKKFLTIPNAPIENKVVPLLQDLYLTERYCRTGFSASTLATEIDWITVNANLDTLRSASHKYLVNALQ